MMGRKILTACICFRNEGEEVAETVRSVSETTQHTKVLLVDDCSDDGYDYRAVADRWGCDYKRMDKRVGSVGTKDWAGRNAASEYFVLLDGHMRFYDKDWDLRLIRLLDKYPKSIISSRTVYRSIKDGKVVDDGVLRSFCACVRFDDGYDFDPKWTDGLLNYNAEDKTSDVACVLGACYATSKSWWNFIGGLSGLTTYGLEESLMSIKTWLCGGCCKVTHDWGVGHLYRDESPNYIDASVIDANRLFLAYLFDANPTLTSCNLYKRLGIFGFSNAMNTFANKFGELQEIKREFENKKIRDINWFKTTINNQVTQ